MTRKRFSFDDAMMGGLLSLVLAGVLATVAWAAVLAWETLPHRILGAVIGIFAAGFYMGGRNA